MRKRLHHWKLVNSISGERVPSGAAVLLPDGEAAVVVSFKPPQPTSPAGLVYVRKEGEEMWSEGIQAGQLTLRVVPG